MFKTAAADVRKIRDGAGPASAPTSAAARPTSGAAVPDTTGGRAAEDLETIPGASAASGAPGLERP